MRARLLVAVATVLALTACGSTGRDGGEIVVATTTSLADTGMLDSLRLDYERETGRAVKVVSVGSGAALALGRRGEADLLLVHSPADEARFVADGFASERVPLMYNHFIIVGPADDPAQVASAPSAVEALRRIAGAGATWVSRDDASGTDALGRALWEQAAVALPDGQHIRSGQGMGATLRVTDARHAYTLGDRATFLTLRPHLAMEILYPEDAALLNPYSVILVDAARFPAGRIRAEGAAAFAQWLAGPTARQRIESFGTERFGEALFRVGSPEEAPHADRQGNLRDTPAPPPD